MLCPFYVPVYAPGSASSSSLIVTFSLGGLRSVPSTSELSSELHV